MKTDKLFYRLFQTQPELALELVGMPAPLPKGYRHQSLELKETSFRLDGILHPPAGYPHVFWEAQLQADKDFYARWLASIFLTLRQERITAWRGLVLFPDRSVDVGDITAYAPLMEQGLIRRVYLEDLEQDAAAVSADNRWGHRLLRLIVAPESSVPLLASELMSSAGARETGIARRQAVDLLETVLIYKLPELSREDIRIMLHLPDTDLKQTRFYREVFAEGATYGELRGEARGVARGKHAGEALLVLRLLKKRFGPLSAEQESEVRALSSEQLQVLAEALLDFHAKADLSAWLMAHR